MATFILRLAHTDDMFLFFLGGGGGKGYVHIMYLLSDFSKNPSVITACVCVFLFPIKYVCVRYCLEPAHDGSGQASQSLYVMPRSILAAPGLPNLFLAYDAGRAKSLSTIGITIADMEAGPPAHFPESIREKQACRF